MMLKQHSAHPLPPGPRGYPLIGVLPQVLSRPLETLTSAARQYGGVVRLGSYRPGGHVILISRPEPLKYVLQERHRAYNRASSRLVRLFGHNMVTLTGESWLERRRLAQPAFHAKYLNRFASVMTDKASSLTEQWRALATRSASIDIADEMSKLTRDIALRFLFGLDFDLNRDEAIAFDRSLKIVVSYLNFLALLNPLPPWAPTPRNRAFRQAIETIDQILYRVIDERHRTPAEERDLVTLLLEARDQETGEGMTDRQLRDEILGMFIGGYETTASALAWTWYLLASHPEVERRLHAEVDEALGGGLPTMEDLPGLAYTRGVMMESMRLYPPVWLFARSLVPDEEDEIEGYAIPRNSILFYSSYVTHRLPDLWENPDAFDPERFTPDRVAKLPQFTYIPFGAGPQQCIGKHFAEMELRLVLAVIAQRYRLRLAPGTRIEPELGGSLRPRNGLPMTLHPRN
jgi:cytochrome P450